MNKIPISKKPDIELIQNIQKYECNESLKELISRHTPICISIYQKYFYKMQESGVSSAEQFEDKDYVIYSAAKNFNPTKNSKYSTWLANQVRYYCLNSMRNKKEIVVDENCLSAFFEKNNHHFDKNYYINLSYINNILMQLKDKRIKKIFDMRYSDKKKTWREIGREFGLSSTMVMLLHNKGCAFLKKKLTNEQFHDKI